MTSPAQDLSGMVIRATEARDEAKEAVEAAEHGVEAATREVAGVVVGRATNRKAVSSHL